MWRSLTTRILYKLGPFESDSGCRWTILSCVHFEGLTMESSACEYNLENLPLEVIEIISQYLSVPDILACTACSHKMRDLFNENTVWRPRCDKELCDYLKVTPCKVIPHFTNPIQEHLLLSPTAEWKIQFMRQNHLWNNWRQGQFKKEIIRNQISERSHYESICHIFLTNDCVIARFPDRIELLDVREYPAAKTAEDISLQAARKYHVKVTAGDETVIVVIQTFVQVYDVNFSTKESHLNQAFFFQKSNKEADFIQSKNLSKVLQSVCPAYPKINYAVISDFFIGVIIGEAKMHIWNLKTGLKLKEQDCPVKNSTIEKFSTSSTMNIVLYLKYQRESWIHTFLILNLITLKFLPFKETFEGSFLCDFCVVDNFVGIWMNDSLNIYNYQTSEKILYNQPIQSSCQILRNNFVFIHNSVLKVFLPLSKVVKCLCLVSVPEVSVTLDGVDWFEILTKKFIQVRKNYALEMYEVCDGFQLKEISRNFWFKTCGFFLNKMGTRYIVRNGYGQVIHFW